MIAIDNLNGNGGPVDLSGIYNELKKINQSVSSFTTLSSLTDDITNLNSSINDLSQMVGSNSANIDLLKTSVFALDYEVLNINSSLSNITNSLLTLNGVYTANSFNNQAFNTTLNLNSDMFITGQFGLNSGSINCNNGIWDLKELKKTFLGSITAKSLSNLTMNNFNLSYCDFSFNNKCLFDDCNLTQCAITGKFINMDNCTVSKCLFDDRKIEFKNITFSNDICFYNGGNISFNNINFSTSNFKFNLFASKYRIYIYNCLIYGNTSATGAFGNMFSNGGGASWEFAFM